MHRRMTIYNKKTTIMTKNKHVHLIIELKKKKIFI
jgi:hypothetical protein